MDSLTGDPLGSRYLSVAGSRTCLQVDCTSGFSGLTPTGLQRSLVCVLGLNTVLELSNLGLDKVVQHLVVNFASKLDHCRKWRFEVRLDLLSSLWVEIFTPQHGSLHILHLSFKDLDPGIVMSGLQPFRGYLSRLLARTCLQFRTFWRPYPRMTTFLATDNAPTSWRTHALDHGCVLYPPNLGRHEFPQGFSRESAQTHAPSHVGWTESCNPGPNNGQSWAVASKLGTFEREEASIFLHNTLATQVFPSSLLPPLLLQTRAILFPNNTLGPAAPPPPTEEEARLIRCQAASDILSIIPKPIARVFLAVSHARDDEDGAMRLEIEESMLSWTSDVEMNKYLVYSILEHVLVRLVPEMQHKTPSELLAERGVLVCGDAAGEDVVVTINGEK
ncbi:hypothetical protein EDD37DRAFT_603530 [Exophiala viscosa]|uniref:uncharacterized protein n=1 Tax=Exophiala viscosa TaxID=2486360 RepID=UPI00219BEA70|nr:hypothetical protein EDD37DRAFT_603530 [Exophiala viscosa]